MATPKFNSKSPTIKRILREAQELSSSPSQDYHAAPASDSDLFDWHFTLRGPPSSAFAGGIYHGRIVLPPTYPLRPPMFRFLNPSGRFEVNREICLSISGHHEESWMPAWGVRTALVALRSFMETDPKGQLGGMECSKEERERLAKQSVNWKCGMCGRSNGEIMHEAEEAASASEQKDGPPKVEEIPKELSLGWKDEMGKEKKSEESDAELAEGFVSTIPIIPDHPASITETTYPPPRPAQTVPQPTGTSTTSSIPTHTPNIGRTQVARQSNDVALVWIDRMIAAVVVCLVALILKVLLGV